MATPLGTTSFTDEEVVAQSDVQLIGTIVETLTVEFDQAKFEALLSSGSLSPKAMRKIHKVSKETKVISIAVADLISKEGDVTMKASNQAKGNAARRRTPPRDGRSTNQRELCVCEPKCDPELCFSFTECKPRVYVPEHKSQAKRDPQWRVSQSKRGSQPRVQLFKRETRVRQGVASDPSTLIIKRESQPRVQLLKREPRVQQGVISEPRVPNLKRGPQPRVQAFRHGACVLNIKRGSQPRVQVFKHDPCVLNAKPSACQGCSHVFKQSVFDQLTNVTWSTERRYSHRKKTSEVEYLGVTSNMISIERLSISNSDGSEENQSPSLKEALNESDGVYRHTRTQTGVIFPVNYQKLGKEIESEDEHSAIAESQSSSSFVEHQSTAYTIENAEDFKKRLEEYQAVMQEALRSQQESINQLRDMVAQLIADRAQDHMFGSTPQPESSRGRSRSSKQKEKVNEASDQEACHIESSSEEKKMTENEESSQLAKMRELEARLNAMANKCKLQDQGVVRPYPAEWDTVPYPPKFKIPTLQAFDGTGSPNQHIYHFKSQTGNAMSNDAILARLFIGTLKGVAFEWFMKLPAGCIQKWADLERLFLSRFFEDGTEISITSLLTIKQKEREPIKAFVERFRSMALRCSTGMTQSALIDTCRHNLQTNLLARMGVAKCRSWKQLVSQGERAESIIAKIEAEKEETDSEDLAIDDSDINHEADARGSVSTNLE